MGNWRNVNIFSLSIIILILYGIGIYAYNFNTSQMPHFEGIPPFDFNKTVNLIFFSWREMTIPLLGIAALSLTAPLQRLLHYRPEKHDFLKVGAALTLIQALFFLDKYRLFLQTEKEVALGFLCVIVAGLMGGRRLGVVVGIMSMLLSGLYFHLTEIALGNNDSLFFYWILANISIVGAIWVGWTVGFGAEQYPNKRFSLRFVLPLVLVLNAGILLALLATRPDTPLQFDYFIPRILTIAIALSLVLFLLRYQQDKGKPDSLTKQELEVVRAELRALRAQINPHFLFNSLSVIHHLTRAAPEHARELILDLSSMMQHTLRAGEHVPLQVEIAHVEAYLALEKARLTKRLHVQWEISDDVPLETPVPTLIMQPIVENAIIHGIAPQPKGGIVKIVIQQQQAEIVIQIEDNGAGFESNQGGLLLGDSQNEERPAIGINNVDQRLRLLYGEAHQLSITSTVGIGTTVTIKIPS